MSSTETHKIIHNMYYDTAGYGSITSTYKEALHKDKTITLNTIKQW